MQIILENNNPTQKEILQPEIYRINVKNGIMGRFIHQIFAIEKRKNLKLIPKYIGFFQILERIGTQIYRIALLT